MRPIRDEARVPVGVLIMFAVLLLATFYVIGSSVPADAGSQPPHEYEIIELPTLGGSTSANTINNSGFIAGLSNLPGDATTHATVWRKGKITDLGTLGGPNSAVLWPNKNNGGLIVGITETEDDDPNDELWSCDIFFPGDPTGNVCVGFVWEDGEMRELSTHGGTHGFATAVNNKGQVVGWAETDERDDSCSGRNQVLGFVGALWDTRHGDQIQELTPLPGDSVSTGNAINDRGQLVGISGICDQAVGRFSARNMALWDRGVARDLGSLGGVAWNTPNAINNKGAVVGFANPSAEDGGDFNPVAFLWTRNDGIRKLDSLEGDTNGQAASINNRNQIVGVSQGANGNTAVIWLDEEVIDLNHLAPEYDGDLVAAGDITDSGTIVGQAINAEGDAVGFMATPTARR